MNETINSCLFLVVLLFVSIYISIYYRNHKNNTMDTMDNSNIEGFASYQDIKTKTLNWCNKMQNVGLLTPDQYNKCVSTFKDSESGILPKEFPVPDTGLGRNYSLYDTKAKKLTPDIAGENTNIVMLVNNDGLYMACNDKNNIYFVSNINDSDIIQKELYFTLVPQNADVYAIMSPYGKYLISNTEWGVGFTGTSIGPMASWNISKVNNKVIIESIQYSEFYLSYNDVNKTIKIEYGKNDNSMWLIIPKDTIISGTSASSVNQAITNITIEYTVSKENILQKLKNINTKHLFNNVSKETLTKLQDTISNNYVNIANYMQKKMNDDQKIYALSLNNYNTRVNSITQGSSTISTSDQQAIIDLIPKPLGLNINNDDMTIVINKINNIKNFYLQKLQLEINNIDKQSIDSNLESLPEVLNDYNSYLQDLQSEINSVNIRIDQNNTIIKRQESDYDKLNTDYASIQQKKDKLETTDKTAKVNTDIISGYNTQNSLLVKIYPIVIIIMIAIVIYLIYITVMKFKTNIYEKY